MSALHPRWFPPRTLVSAALVGAVLVGLAVSPAPASVAAPAATSPTVPASPRPAHGPHVSKKRSVLDVRALGDVRAAKAEEQRNYEHSAIEPTGRFVRRGTKLTVTLPAARSGLTAVIGQYGVYSALNGGKDTPLSTISLRPRTTTITAPQDGLVNIVDPAPEGSRTTRVVVNGGEAVPTFTLGQTKPAAFDAAVAKSSAPFGVFIGDRVVAEMQLPSVSQHLARGTAADRVRALDQAVNVADATWGLSRSGAGATHRADHRVLIASPDTGPGWASSAAHRITFQVSTGAAKELLSRAPDETWSIWHEIGHTYQPPIVNWDGLGETSVNITALSVERHLGLPNRLDNADNRAAARKWFAQTLEARSFEKASVWVKLLMFDQLTRAFGENFPRAPGAVGTSPVPDGCGDAR